MFLKKTPTNMEETTGKDLIMFNSKNEIKSTINELLKEIENVQQNQKKIREVRTQIAALIENTIKFLNHRNEFGLWEKDIVASAMSRLNWNINNKEITTSWLCLCLVEIELALTDSSQRSPSYPHNQKRADEINKLKPDEYINVLSDLKRLV